MKKLFLIFTASLLFIITFCVTYVSLHKISKNDKVSLSDQIEIHKDSLVDSVDLQDSVDSQNSIIYGK